ncbi:flavoprotein, partial [Acinetobacter baumannii]
ILNMLSGKKILIGISASIAAYKSILLIRALIKEGAEVKVVMTPAAKDFVSPLVLSTLSKNKVAMELSSTENEWENHVRLGRWADLML